MKKTATKPAKPATVKTLRIVKTFATVSEALAASKIDLAYNPQAAKEKASQTDRPHNGCHVEKAFLMDDGNVWYVYQCDIRLLNEFSPFHSTLHNGAFYPVKLTDKKAEIMLSLALPRESRKTIKAAGMLVTTL